MCDTVTIGTAEKITILKTVGDVRRVAKTYGFKTYEVMTANAKDTSCLCPVDLKKLLGIVAERHVRNFERVTFEQ